MQKSVNTSSISKNLSSGLFMLTVVVVAWVSSSFLLNSIFESNYYRKPVFITFCSVSSCSLYLLPLLKQLIKLYWKNGGYWDIQTAYKLQYYPNLIESTHNDDTNTFVVYEKSDNPESNQFDNRIIPLSSVVKLSMVFCTLWFGANITTNTSLSYTSVTSQTILSSTASFFTLFFSVIMGIDTINLYKLLGLIVSFIGIVIIVIKSTPVSTRSQFPYTSIVIGNILALLGALIYGIYSTFFKKALLHMSNKKFTNTYDNPSKIDVKLYLGFVGLFTFIGLWPILIVYNYFGWEPFELKWNFKIILIIILNSSVTFLSNYCWAKAIILMSPLIVTMGLSFTMPLAMFGDFMFKGKQITCWYVIGSLLIVLSFLLININSETSTNNNDHDSQKKLLSNCENVESYGAIEV